MYNENNPSTEALAPGLDIAMILMDKAQTSYVPWALDRIKTCDGVWELLLEMERNIYGPMVARIAPIVAKLDPEYLDMDEWPWSSQVPRMMEPYRHHACEWLAGIRAASIPCFEETLEEAVVWAKIAREDACECLATYGFLEEFVDIDLNEEAGDERLVRDALIDGFEVKSGIDWLVQLGLIVIQDDVPVFPSTKARFEIACDRLYATLHQRVRVRGTGYFHPCKGWIQVRVLSADEHARIRAASAEVLGG